MRKSFNKIVSQDNFCTYGNLCTCLEIISVQLNSREQNEYEPSQMVQFFLTVIPVSCMGFVIQSKYSTLPKHYL